MKLTMTGRVLPHLSFLLTLYLILSASVAAQIKKTDREYDGFFGSVRTVIEERATLSGTREKPVESGRQRLESRTYDQEGNLVERIVYGGDGGKGIIARNVFSFDSEGNRVERSYAGGSSIPAPTDSQPAQANQDRAADGAYLYKIIYKYDGKGNRLEESAYRGGGAFVYQVLYEYNENGLVIKREVKQADGTVDKVSYSYLNAIVTPKAEVRSGGETVKYSYGLDEQGNWTLRLGYPDKKKTGEVGEAHFRTITYYDNSSLGKAASALPRDLVRPVPINAPQPRYSEPARKHNVEGNILLRVLVGEDGLVKQAIVTKGLPDGLNDEAYVAASALKFKPALLFGKPIQFWQIVMIEFRLRSRN